VSTHYEFHKNKNADKNPHYFMSEELLIPRASNSDTQRINMFSNHINQFVHLIDPEFPKIFTNFENQIGEYSVAYKKAKEPFIVLARVDKNKYNYDLIVQYLESRVFDILHYKRGVNITEDYGYELQNTLGNVQMGDIVNKDDYIYKSSNYDDDGNYSYGLNLKSVFLPWNNLTYEDGVIISESAAERMKAHKIEQTMFSVNSNDILLNIYGDQYYYKSFPRVGEKTTEKILSVIRRKDNNKSLFDFQLEKLMREDSKDDTIIYTNGGEVIDIDIFCNKPLGELEKNANEFTKEVIDLYKEELRYYTELAAELEKIIPIQDKSKVVAETITKKNGSTEILTLAEKEKKDFGHSFISPVPKEENENEYTDELAYYWKKAHEYIDPKITWRHEGKSFDNFKIRFTILKESKMTIGAKITGRLNFHSLRNSVMNYKQTS
jgi:DNA-directed RNA polymerase beta subunit